MEYPKLPISNENGKKPAVYLTVDELIQLFGSVIESKLKDFKPTPLPLTINEEHLNYSQAVAFLKISKPTFAKLRRDGSIKGTKVGLRRVLFSRSSLESYLLSNHEK
ncbi:MAG: helix-turn-helix domain-containing protein [Arcicella sp.]|nr:helix-turn-helix domain-containing protein [Arcicella sp.]